MENIAKLLLLALTAFKPMERLGANAGRMTTAALCAFVAAVALVAGLGCLTASFWIALAPYTGQAGAALCAALALGVVAIVLWLIARHNYERDRRPADPLEDLGAIGGLFNDDMQSELKRLFGENKVPLIIAALVAGLALGGSQGRRR